MTVYYSLDPAAKIDAVKEACASAKAGGYEYICVPQWFVSTAAEALADSPVGVSTILSLPGGTTSSKSKYAEAKWAIVNGADLLIFPVNMTLCAAGEFDKAKGDLDSALKNFNSSLTLAMAFPNWMAKVTYVEGVSGREKGATPWGVSRRATPIGVFPSKATIIIGEGETQATRQLGIVAEQHAMAIDPIEILRCIALSIRRRVDIIGPLAPYDPMSTEILETFRTRAVAPNHWSLVLLDVIWGLALEECDKTQSSPA